MILNITPESAAGGVSPDEAIINRLPAVRAETRAELFRRLLKGRAFLEANYAKSADLNATARVACLSPFHFLRLFKTAFGRTPHQYLTWKRINKAKDLLSENKPVTEVCNEVGFESIGSFSVLFKKEIGFAPTYYRNMAWLKKQKQKEQPRSAVPYCFIAGYKLDEKPSSKQ